MKVYFSGNFSTHERFERPGQEWGCDAYSSWADENNPTVQLNLFLT